jgi:riboflavin synthase
MKGSSAIDGVSLTVSDLGDDWLEVNLIPHTLKETSLSDRKPGDELNLEGDILGKYVARLLGGSRGRSPSSSITEETLRENGFI